METGVVLISVQEQGTPRSETTPKVAKGGTSSILIYAYYLFSQIFKLVWMGQRTFNLSVTNADSNRNLNADQMCIDCIHTVNSYTVARIS